MTVDGQKACKGGDTPGWLCGRAEHIRTELGADNPIQVSTGGVGGDISWGCTFIDAATQCDAIDIISVHRYASYPGNWAGSAQNFVDSSNGKLVFVEEWGINSAKVDIGSAFTVETDDLNSFAMPNTYWQILPKKDDACSDYDPKNDGDPFGIFIDGPADIGKAAKGASSATAKQDWSALIN
jgi:mannan endo-1,4-beta-mannosidase